MTKTWSHTTTIQQPRHRLLTLLLFFILLLLFTTHISCTSSSIINNNSTTTTTTTTVLSCYSTPGCIQHFQSISEKCLGRYCGRHSLTHQHIQFVSNSKSECKACPRGYKTDGWVCVPCQRSTMKAYSIFFIIFMFGLVPVINLMSIEHFGVSHLSKYVICCVYMSI